MKKISGRLKAIWPGRDSTLENKAKMLRLLVVDGEESICFSLREYFTLQHYNVDIAQDLDVAESRIETASYDVVIQDLMLGPTHHLDGLEMIKFIRTHNSNTRIVVLTAYGSPETEKEAMQYGADAFLLKPKPLSHIAQVIQGLIESPRKQRAHGTGLG